MRKDRSFNQMREISFEKNVNIHADGSCLVKFGNTHVLCLATIDEKVPHWLKNTGKGCVTAEYGMLPRSTNTRMDREAARGKQSGRTQEIQRLIGRSLRSIIDLSNLGERQIKIDCDVIQADGGTRTASISGGFVSLYLAIEKLKNNYNLQKPIIKNFIGAVSTGIVDKGLNLVCYQKILEHPLQTLVGCSNNQFYFLLLLLKLLMLLMSYKYYITLLV